jgi:hypothetical protein
MEYRGMLADDETLPTCDRAAENEFGHLTHVVGGRIEGSNTIFLILVHRYPKSNQSHIVALWFMYGPTKRKFCDPPLKTYLALEGWTDVSPPGSTTEEESGDPLLDDNIRMIIQLVIIMQLLRMALTAMGDTFKWGQSWLGESTDALEGHIHDTKLRLGTHPGYFACREVSAWDGIANVHGTLEAIEAKIKQGVTTERSEMQTVCQYIKEEALSAPLAEFHQFL